MNIKLEGSEGYTALLNASRKEIAKVQPFDMSDEMMDKALQEECWQKIFGDAGERPERPKSERAQDHFGSASARQIQSALTAAKLLPEVISGPGLLDVVGTHFEVFSGPAWQHYEARVSLLEYLGLALAIHALKTLIDKDEYNKEDITLFLSTLKQQAIAPDARMLEFSFSGGQDTAAPRRTAPTFDLSKPEDTRSRMVAAVHDRYFSGDTNLYGDKRKQYEAKFAAASSAADKIEALVL